MMIFPGMDPYLEHPQLWTGVHTSLIVYFRDQLQPQLRPRYVAAIEERVYVEEADVQRVPDLWIRRTGASKKNGKAALLDPDAPVVVRVPREEVHERYVAILDVHSNEKLVTLVELVSPSNKKKGEGRVSYIAKQKEAFAGNVSLVEIDLLRNGSHVMAIPEWAARERCGDYAYLACVNRAQEIRDKYDLYPRTLPQRLPRIQIPLAGMDADVILDVQDALEKTWEAASYDLRIRYDDPCDPPLSKKDQTWANDLIRKAKRKRSR